MQSLVNIPFISLILFLALAGSAHAITIDGNPADWAGVGVSYSDPAGDMVGAFAPQDIRSLRIANDSTNVYLLLETIMAASGADFFLFIDTDSNPLSGCTVYSAVSGIGFEFGITLSENPLNASFGSYIGDARDCGWNLNDFPGVPRGGLSTVALGNYWEAAFPISTLQILAPGLHGFALDTGNDHLDWKKEYQLETSTDVPEPSALALSALAFVFARRRKPRV